MLPFLRVLVSNITKLLKIVRRLIDSLIKSRRQADGLSHLNIGYNLNDQGHYHDSLKQFEQALDHFQKIKDLENEGTTLCYPGTTYRNLGQYTKALNYNYTALAIYRQIKNRKRETDALCGIGTVYYYLGQYSEALQYYNHSLIIRREIGDRKGEAEILNNTAPIYESLGQNQQASETIKHCWKLIELKIIATVKPLALTI